MQIQFNVILSGGNFQEVAVLLGRANLCTTKKPAIANAVATGTTAEMALSRQLITKEFNKL